MILSPNTFVEPDIVSCSVPRSLAPVRRMGAKAHLSPHVAEEDGDDAWRGARSLMQASVAAATLALFPSRFVFQSQDLAYKTETEQTAKLNQQPFHSGDDCCECGRNPCADI